MLYQNLKPTCILPVLSSSFWGNAVANLTLFWVTNFFFLIYELPHDKTNKMTVHPAKTQMSLGIRPV